MTRFQTLQLKEPTIMIRDARIIDNENFKKINAWQQGLTDIEGLSENAKAISNEAKKQARNAEDKAGITQQQLDNIILENGNSEAEVVQARGGEALLYQRLDKNDQRMTTNTKNIEMKPPTYHRQTIEVTGEPHEQGFDYTAFFTGVNIKGKEVHVGRIGHEHVSDDSGLVAYVRQPDGDFERKYIAADYTMGDFRDPNLSYDSTGEKLYLTIAVKRSSDGNYRNVIMELDERDLTVKNQREMTGTEGYFTWGNMISTEDNQSFLTLCYLPGSDGYGVSLFESGTVDNTAHTHSFKKLFDLFPASDSKPTEATIGRWGEKIVAITRQNNGNMLYRETYDLNGRTGWRDVQELSFSGDAPGLQQYTPGEEPLLLGYSTRELSESERTPALRYTYDGVSFSDELLVEEYLEFQGGYHSIVPNDSGYGMMWYEDGDVWSQSSSVYYKEFQPMKRLENKMINMKSKDNSKTDLLKPYDVSKSFTSNLASLSGMIFEVKKTLRLQGIEILTKGNNSQRCAIYDIESNQDVAESNALPLASNPQIELFRFPEGVDLEIGKKYEIRFKERGALYSKFSEGFNKIEAEDFIYLASTYDGDVVKDQVIPFQITYMGAV